MERERPMVAKLNICRLHHADSRSVACFLLDFSRESTVKGARNSLYGKMTTKLRQAINFYSRLVVPKLEIGISSYFLVREKLKIGEIDRIRRSRIRRSRKTYTILRAPINKRREGKHRSGRTFFVRAIYGLIQILENGKKERIEGGTRGRG